MTYSRQITLRMQHLSFITLWASLVMPGFSFAQSSNVEDEAIEEIVVTGSRIKRRDLTSPSPILTLERTDIETSPQGTMEEMLNQMPQVTPGFGRTSNNPGSGTAHINLRGMGPGRTLVMLNSRRLAPSGTGSAVDVNNIPQALIERVELITGGASTVYGSDAIAGVVNFITRDDFQGASVEARYGVTEKGDSAYYDLSLAFGTDFANGRGNVVVYGGFYDREETFASQRKLTSTSWFEDTDTGILTEGGSFVTPSGNIVFPEVDFGTGGTQFTTFNSDGTPREFLDPDDVYNFQEVNYLQIPLTRKSAGIMASYEIGNSYELYLESSYARNEAVKELAPVPAFDFLFINTDNPVLAPETQQFFNDNFLLAPGLAGVFLLRRLNELGPRRANHKREYWRTVLGIKGELGRGWDIDAWVTYTKSDETQLLFNDGSASRLAQGLLVDPATGQCFDPSGGCVPLDIFGAGRISPEGIAFLGYPSLVNTTERVQKLASVFVTGSPFEIWAGPVDIAAGLEWRSDEAHFEADEALFTGDTLGYRGAAPVDGTETVIEVYAEAIVPLLQGVAGAEYLGLELGARYSEYDNAGGVWTYKLGGAWEPVESLRVRAMYQRSVRAPNNRELFTEQFAETGFYVGNNTDNDPCSASADPVGNGQAEKCVIQGLPADQVGIFEATPFFPTDFIQGGNPDLVPEAAETFTVGAILTPAALPNWNFAVDYYQLEITDAIGGINASSICFDLSNTDNIFCDKIRRGPSGNVFEVEELSNNRGLLSTRGIDTQINYNTDLPDGLSLFGGGAQFNIHFVWTHMIDVKNQENPVSVTIECAGYFGSPCSGVNGTAVDDRIATNFSYNSGPLGMTLSSRWIEGTKNFRSIETQFFGGPEPLLAIPSIGSEHFMNFDVRYEFSDNVSASLGIANITDNDAPQMADAVFNNNTDTLLYDIFGRSYYATLALRFGN